MTTVSNNYSNNYSNYASTQSAQTADQKGADHSTRPAGRKARPDNSGDAASKTGDRNQSNRAKGSGKAQSHADSQQKLHNMSDTPSKSQIDDTRSVSIADTDVPEIPVSQLDGGFVKTGKNKINFQVSHPDKGEIIVAIDHKQISLYIPQQPQEGVSDDLDTIANSKPVQLRFADVQNWTPENLEMLDSIGGAFRDFDPVDKQTPGAALGQTVKARLEALQDPNFWNQVGELHAAKTENPVTLANGQEVIVKNEYDLEPVSKDSKGVKYSVHNPGDGKTTHNVRVTKDGLHATIGSKKGDENPIRIAEDGSVKVVLGFEEYSEIDSRENTISDLMTTYESAAPIRSLPVAKPNGNTDVSLIEMNEKGRLSIEFARDQGALERVDIGFNSITFTTRVPDGVLEGVNLEPDADGFITFERSVNFADIDTLSNTDAASFNTLKEALSSIDASNYLPTQESTLNKMNARLESLEDPLFWNSVNSEIQSRLNNVMNGEPVEINEEYKLTQRTPINEHGSSTVEFFVDRGKGEEKLELQEGNKVSIGEEKFDVRQDEQSGDWFLVTDFNTIETLSRKVISTNMKKASAMAETSDRIPLINVIDNGLRQDQIVAANTASGSDQD